MAGQPRARRQARPMIARTSFSIAATRYCCLQILSAGRREWCQGHCVVGLLLITALMRSLGRAVGVAGGAGDVGLAVAAVVSDGGVAQHGGDGGAVAGAGLVSVLAEGDVADPVQPVLDVPFQPRPVVELVGLGLLGGRGDDQVGGLPAGLAADGAGDAYGLGGVREAQPARCRDGDGSAGAGLPAAVTALLGAVPDTDLRPR